MLHDFRLALRLLGKDRTFTLTALLTLAVTIGANTAIFSVVRSVLLKPLPVSESDRILLVYNSYPNAGAPRAQAAVPDYFDRLAGTNVFASQAVYRRQGMTLGRDEGAERVRAVRATPSFFRLVRVQAAEGRTFTDAEGEMGEERKVVLTDAFRRRYFGSEPVIGREMRLNGLMYAIVGVLPARFTYLWNDIDVWVPAAFTAQEKSDDGRHSNNWTMIARLEDGATLEQAQQQIDAINARNDDRFPQFRQLLKDAGFHTVAVKLQDDVVRDVRPVLYLLWGGVLFVLLIGCVNIANLVIVRSTSRAREMATRHAIGADRWRLARQLVTETTCLALVGGGLGVLAGWWALGSITTLGIDQLPRGFEISLDAETVAFVLGLAGIVGLVTGLVPVTRLSRVNLAAALRDEGRSGTSGRTTNALRRALATAQVAIAVTLLVGAGLMLASFRAVLHANPGFDPAGVATAVVSLPTAAYKDDPSLASFAARLLGELRSQPSVASAGVTSVIPFSDDFNSSVIVAEGYQMKPGESVLSPMQTVVSDGYFETMKIPLVGGRYFTASDTAASQQVVIVDERLAKKFWPDRDPLGRRMYLPGNAKDLLGIDPNTKFITVVGIVKEVRLFPPGVDIPQVGAYYFPFSQKPERGFVLAVRTSLAADTIVNVVRKQVTSLDRELPVFDTQSMAARIDGSLIARRVPMLIASVFSVVALFLSAIGIYGVLAYGVTQRRREIGIRMALGSSAREVFGLVLGDGARLVGVGLFVGLAGGYLAGRAMEGQLYEVQPLDPTVVGLVVVLLTVVACLATIGPARRAARVNPLNALNDN